MNFIQNVVVSEIRIFGAEIFFYFINNRRYNLITYQSRSMKTERKSVAALTVYVLFRAAEIFHNHNSLLNRVYTLSGSVFDRDLTAFENEKINSNAPNVQLTGSAMQTPV